MIKLVVTGSIGMGKSTTAKMFAELGGADWYLYDADDAVHALYEKGGAAVQPLAEIFPESIKNGAVDRTILSKLVLGHPEKIKQLEAIVHPLTRKKQLEFIQNAMDKKAKGVIFDIPLFFETNSQQAGFADYIIVVSAPFEIQKKRTLARRAMTEEKFHSIRERQVPDEEKRKGADFIVETQFGIAYAKKQIANILKKITEDGKK